MQTRSNDQDYDHMVRQVSGLQPGIYKIFYNILLSSNNEGGVLAIDFELILLKTGQLHLQLASSSYRFV